MAGPGGRNFFEEFVEAGELILRWGFGWRGRRGAIGVRDWVMLDKSIISAAN